MTELEPDEKGDFGEDRAKVFVRTQFREIMSRPSPDRGTDLICSGPRWLPAPRGATTPMLRLQVKCGASYDREIGIAATTLENILQRIEREPVIFLYYHDADNDYPRPDCFLVLHNWVIRHIDDVRRSLENNTRLKIPHGDFVHSARSEHEDLRGAIEGECLRATSCRGHIMAPRHDQLPEYAYLRQFARVIKLWEVFLLPSEKLRVHFGVGHPSQIHDELLRALDSEESVLSILSRVERSGTHPLSRRPPSELESAQQQYYKALLDYDARRRFTLPRRFTVSEAAAARALAAKYPNLLSLAEHVLTNWRLRPVKEILNATQLAAALSHYEKDAEDRVVACFSGIATDLCNMPITSFDTYRLAHHVWEAYAEATGDDRFADTAVDLASRHLHWELQHLKAYGWGVGRHVLNLYGNALKNNSIRGQKLQRYNQRMRELMGGILL